MIVSTISGCNTGIGRYAHFVARNFDAKSVFFKIKDYEDSLCFQNTVRIRPIDLLFSYYFYSSKIKKFFIGKDVFFSSPDLVNYARYVRAIVTVHDVFPLEYKVKAFYKEYFKRMLKNFGYTLAIIVNSYYTKNKLEAVMEKFNVDPVPIYVVHLGVMGLPKISHDNARKLVLNWFGLDKEKRIILNVANAQERKNLKEISDIKRRLKDFVFINVGHNNTYGDINLERIDNGALSVLMAGADLCLSTSIDEGFNLPIIECSFYGTPAVARNIPVHEELSQHQKIFLYNNVEEALETIKNVSDTRVDFSEYFSEDRLASDLRRVLEKYYFLKGD